MTAAWVPCRCGNYWCQIHGQHAHDCECPPIEEWGDVDPYSDGGPPSCDCHWRTDGILCEALGGACPVGCDYESDCPLFTPANAH